MRLTWKDAAATVLVAAVIVPYIGFAVWGSMPFIQDPSGMAELGLILGLIGAAIGGWLALDPTGLVRFAIIGVGLVSFALGCLVLASETFLDVTVRLGLLMAFVVTIVVLWASAIARHAGVGVSGVAPTGAAHA